MPISKVTNTDFQKAIVTTGAGQYNLPRDMVDPLYSPGWPIQPINRPEDSELPRTLDYPFGINYTLTPRIGYEGLMPVKALKAAYTNVTEVATPVNLIIRELSSFKPTLRDIKTQTAVTSSHPYLWMTISPDRVNPFNVWMARYKKSAKVYAAPAFYKRKQDGKTVAMEYIDGSTLFLIINSRGDLPMPNEVDDDIKKYVQQMQSGNLSFNDKMPLVAQNFLKAQRNRLDNGKDLVTTTPAFTQIIKGVPFSFWDKNQIYFVPEPPSPSIDSPYGESYIERAWAWIQLVAVMTAFELGHYKTGNMPEGLMTMPKDIFPSMTKLAQGEREWNNRMTEGSQVQHARIRWAPENTKFIPTKKPDFPDLLYQKANQNILHAIGVPPSELGERPSKGLGGKGFEEGAAKDVTRQLLEVEKSNIENAFNKVLLEDGVADVEFYLDYPQEEIDPTKQQEDLLNKFKAGIETLNGVLTIQGREPIGNPKDPENIANMHLIILGGSVYAIEKMQLGENGAAQASIGSAQPPAQQGGSPVNPDEEGKGAKGNEKEDKEKAKEVMKLLESTGGSAYTGITYSIPSLVKNEKKDEVEIGIEEETKEHGKHFSSEQIKQIVEDHLGEDSEYYSTEHGKEAMKGGQGFGENIGHPFRGDQYSDKNINLENYKKISGQFSQEIKESENKAIGYYMNGGYDNLNVKIRNGDKLSKEERMLAASLDSSLKKYKTENKLTVYRRIQETDDLTYETILKNYNQGKQEYLSDFSYLSTSLSKEEAEMFATGADDSMEQGFIMDITVPKGKNCIPTGGEEYEMIFGRNSKMKIVSFDDSNRTIYMEMQ